MPVDAASTPAILMSATGQRGDSTTAPAGDLHRICSCDVGAEREARTLKMRAVRRGLTPMFRLGILAAGLLSLSGCSDECGNVVIRRAVAPDGLHSTIMFQRDCGATTGFSTQISVLGRGEKLSGGGNAFRADTDQGTAASGEWGGPLADVAWVDNSTLLVRFASGSRIFEQRRQVGDVRINYQEVERAGDPHPVDSGQSRLTA